MTLCRDDFSDLPVFNVHLSPLIGLRFKTGFESLLLPVPLSDCGVFSAAE